MPRVKKPLTDTEIKKAKPKEKEYPLSDGNGLILRVKPNGSKIWLFNYYHPVTQKRTNAGLGMYPQIQLAAARAKREEYRSLLAQGIDPQEHKKKALEATNEQIKNSFLAVAEKWKEKKVKEVEASTLEKNWRRLELYAFPKFGQIPVTDILPALIIQTLEPLNQQGKGDTLKRTIRLINEILNYAVNYGLIQFNPCLNVNAVFNFGKNENNPTIRPEELPALLKAVRDSRLTLFTRCLIKFQLLTLTRPVESSSAEWSEIDLDNRLWSIPAERMKAREAHVIPLSSQAVQLLETLHPVTGRFKYVFPKHGDNHASMSSSSANTAIKRMGYAGRQTAHGLRGLARTYLAEQNTNHEHAEACLAHKTGGNVSLAYNHATYLEQRKAIMQQWGNFVENCATVNTL